MSTLLAVLAVVLLGILVYKFWKPMIQPPKRAVKANEANLYFFYTNWCGFSQKAMPEWTKLEAKLKSESYFGKTHVNAIAVDCEVAAHNNITSSGHCGCTDCSHRNDVATSDVASDI